MATPRRWSHGPGDLDDADRRGLTFDEGSVRGTDMSRHDAELTRREEDLTPSDSGNPWTATRCSRLLRPLRGAIQGFKREQAMSNNLSKISSDDVDLKEAELGRAEGRSSDDSAIEEGDDPDFFPQHPKPYEHRRGTTTYRTRSRRQSGRDGERIIHEARNTSFQMEVEKNLRFLFGDWPLRDARHARHVSADISHANVRGRSGIQIGGKVSFALESFLTATEVKRPRSRRRPRLSCEDTLDRRNVVALQKLEERNRPSERTGTQSLFQTCLEQMPKFVAYVQESIEDEDEDDADDDAASHVFEELEKYSSANNGGWRALREVVRSQGVYELCEAVRDGVFAPKTIQSLAEVCLRKKHEKGARLIVDAWVDALIAGKLRCLRPVLQLGAVRHTAEQAGCAHVLWNILVRAADDGDASVFSEPVRHMLWSDWQVCLLRESSLLTRESTYAWLHRLITFTLTSRALDLDQVTHNRRLIAARLMPSQSENAGPQSPDQGLQTSFAATLSALLVYLSTVVLGDETDGHPSSESAASLLSRIVSEIASVLWSHPRLEMSGAHAAIALMPWLSARLVGMTRPSLHVFSERQNKLFVKLAQSRGDDELVSCLSQHVSMTAIHQGRMLGESNKQVVKTVFHRAIAELEVISDNEDIPVLMSVAKMTAQYFAERFPTKANVKFALDVEARAGMDSDERDLMSSPMQTTPGKYRWEESVSEWVACTPCRNPSGISVVVPHQTMIAVLPAVSVGADGLEAGPRAQRQQSFEEGVVLCSRRGRRSSHSIDSERDEDTFSDSVSRSETPASTVSNLSSRSEHAFQPMVIVPDVSLHTRVVIENRTNRKRTRNLKRKSYGEIEDAVAARDSLEVQEHVSKRLRSRAPIARIPLHSSDRRRVARNLTNNEEGARGHRSQDRRRYSMPARLCSASAVTAPVEAELEQSEDELAQ